jgi:hypothetical protein
MRVRDWQDSTGEVVGSEAKFEDVVEDGVGKRGRGTH